jgi:hypothetical protein
VGVLDQETAVKLWQAFVAAGYDATIAAVRRPPAEAPPSAVITDELPTTPLYTVRVMSPGKQLGIDVLDIAREHGVSLQTSDALLG